MIYPMSFLCPWLLAKSQGCICICLSISSSACEICGPISKPTAALPIERRRPKPESIRPAMAMPRLLLLSPKMPVMTPAIARGAPQMGRHQANNVMMPRISEAIAKRGGYPLTVVPVGVWEMVRNSSLLPPLENATGRKITIAPGRSVSRILSVQRVSRGFKPRDGAGRDDHLSGPDVTARL
jgi:hypothetical protein